MTLPLDADQPLSAARQRASLDDLGDDTLPERLAGLVDQLDGRLTGQARASAAQVTADLLEQRLRFF